MHIFTFRFLVFDSQATFIYTALLQ